MLLNMPNGCHVFKCINCGNKEFTPIVRIQTMRFPDHIKASMAAIEGNTGVPTDSINFLMIGATCNKCEQSYNTISINSDARLQTNMETADGNSKVPAKA